MSAAAILLCYVVLTATLGRALLRRWSGASRSPFWGILTWQALSVSAAVSLLLAGVAVAVPLLPVRSHLAEVARTTPFAIVEHYQTPVGAWPGYLTFATSAALAVAVLVRATLATARAVRRRHRQRATLRLVGEQHPDGVVVIDHEAPVVYCLPGRGAARIVVSSSALQLLSAEELRLVLGHEHRHLRARHDLALVAGEALAATFRWVPLLGGFLIEAHERTAALAEMAADDAASGRPERQALARALVAISAGGRHASPTGAPSVATLARVRRLVSDAPTGLGVLRAGTAGVIATVLLAAPLALAIAPAVESATRECCSATRAPAPLDGR